MDRLRLVVFPVITGKTGRDRIFDRYPDVALDMVSSRTFDARTAAARGAPAEDVAWEEHLQHLPWRWAAAIAEGFHRLRATFT